MLGNLFELVPLGPGTDTERGSGAVRWDWRIAELGVQPNLFSLGLSGQARILNWVQVPLGGIGV